METLSTLESDLPDQSDLERKQKLVSQIALSMALILSAYLLITNIASPGWFLGRSIALICTLLLFALSRTGRSDKYYKPSAMSIVAIIIIGGTAASLSNDGAQGFVAPILIMAPIVAGLFLGARATILSAFLAVISLGALVALDQAGVVTSSRYDEPVLPMISMLWLSVTIATATAAVAYFSSDSAQKIATLSSFQAKLMHAAHHDLLTGAGNRQGLQSFLRSKLQNVSDDVAQICFIHIDLDHFKEINDTHGHPTGDAVLRRTTKRMQSECQERDYLSRIGGDEFVIVRFCPTETDASEIQTFCDRLISSIQKPINANGRSCSVGASIGFVISDTASCSVETLIANADYALYQAKRDGRGAARQFTALLNDKINYERALVAEVEEAWETRRIALALQPLMCMSTGEVLGIESLGRLRTTNGDLLLPGQFLNKLERQGRLHEFDLEVTRQSLSALVQMRAAGVFIPRISVNASASSLRTETYARDVVSAIEHLNLDHETLVVEISESILIENATDDALRTVSDLRAAGIQVVMDDFGSGYASFAQFLKLDLDGLKIDRSLLEDIECARTQKIIRTVMGISNDLPLPTVIEGVETAQQFAVLKTLGAECVQGFGVCKPKEMADLIDWFENRKNPMVLQLQQKTLTG